MLVLTPVTETVARIGELAPRPASLKGLRLGVVDNKAPNATAFLRRISERLRTEQGMSEVAWGNKLEEVKDRSDAILDGVGH